MPVFIIALVFTLFQVAIGESCYECSSEQVGQRFCNNAVSDNTTTRICEEDTCKVQVQMSNGAVTYRRDCNSGEECVIDIFKSGQDSIINECCQGHTCNGRIVARMIECYFCNPSSGNCFKEVHDDTPTITCPGQCYSSYSVTANEETYERGCSLLSCPRSSNTRTMTPATCCTTNRCNANIEITMPTTPAPGPPSSDAVTMVILRIPYLMIFSLALISFL